MFRADIITKAHWIIIRRIAISIAYPYRLGTLKYFVNYNCYYALINHVQSAAIVLVECLLDCEI